MTIHAFAAETVDGKPASVIDYSELVMLGVALLVCANGETSNVVSSLN